MDVEFEEKFSDDSDNEEDYEEEQENISLSPNEIDIDEFYNNYEKNKKNFKTTPVLTKYEKTRIISERFNNYQMEVFLL